jgi:hypothetical protein
MFPPSRYPDRARMGGRRGVVPSNIAKGRAVEEPKSPRCQPSIQIGRGTKIMERVGFPGLRNQTIQGANP